MKVIDTTGTNIKIKRTPGKNEWFYSVDGEELVKATFNKCLEIVTIARQSTKNKMIGIDAEGYYYNKEQQVRVTLCCKSFVTYHDDILCCKECWEEMDELIMLTPILATK